MDSRVLDIATDLYFNYTNSRIEASESIPYLSQSTCKFVKKFKFNNSMQYVGYMNKETGAEDKRLAIKTDDLVFYPKLRSSLGDHRDRLIIEKSALDLIKLNVLQPFLLFIRGKFVRWSEIYIMKDIKYTTIVVDSKYFPNSDTDPFLDSDIKILQLPILTIKYSESKKFYKDMILIFGFDEDGTMNIDGPTFIYMTPGDIGYIQLRLPGGAIVEDDIAVPDECRLYPSNIIVFKDHILYPEATISISPYNTMTIDDGKMIGLEYKMFYDKRVNRPYNNVSQIINHEYLKDTYLNTKPNPEWMSILHKEFDYKFDPAKSYDANLTDFASYMISYNYRKLIDGIKSSNVHSYSGYIGDIPHDDRSNRLLMFPKEYLYSNTGYMLFVNGILSSKTVIREESYGIYANFLPYSEDSIYEIVIFKNLIGDILYCNTTPIDSETKYFTGYDSFGNDFDLYCAYHPEEIFEIYESMRHNVYYKINTTDYTVYEDGIVFTNPFYLDNKFILKTPKYMYAHQTYTVKKEEDFEVHLDGSKFGYCVDRTHYMVFLNGYKVDSSLYKVITPLPTTPFDDQAIYFSIVLHKGDMVDIYYTAMSVIDEVKIDDLDHSTVSGTGIDQLGYITGPTDYPVPISRDLQFFFVNGIKIPREYLMDISYNMARLVINMKTIENLSIIGFDTELIALFKSLELKPSELDKVYEAHDKSGINILTNTYTAVTNTRPIRPKEIEDHALINEIVRHYYGHVNKGVPFRYDFDSSVYTEIDAGGNIVIDVMDGTKKVNLTPLNGE